MKYRITKGINSVFDSNIIQKPKKKLMNKAFKIKQTNIKYNIVYQFGYKIFIFFFSKIQAAVKICGLSQAFNKVGPLKIMPLLFYQ